MDRIPSKGERFTFQRHEGYVCVQDRPFPHREADAAGHIDPPWSGRCQADELNGRTIRTEGEITAVIFYMDNSVEVEGVSDEGEILKQMLVAPHGDLC